MTPLFKKLNFKNQEAIFILNAPDTLLQEMNAMQQYTVCNKAVEATQEINFVLLFATQLTQLQKEFNNIKNNFIGDCIIWICYPKQSSKKYACDFNRDSLAQNLGNAEILPVRQISIDADWSALRFRKTAFIFAANFRNIFTIKNWAINGRYIGKKCSSPRWGISR